MWTLSCGEALPGEILVGVLCPGLQKAALEQGQWQSRSPCGGGVGVKTQGRIGVPQCGAL